MIIELLDGQPADSIWSTWRDAETGAVLTICRHRPLLGFSVASGDGKSLFGATVEERLEAPSEPGGADVHYRLRNLSQTPARATGCSVERAWCLQTLQNFIEAVADQKGLRPTFVDWDM